MKQKNWKFSIAIVRVCILGALVGAILIGCTNVDNSDDQRSTESKSSQKIDIRGNDVRVENSQKIDIQGQDIRVNSKTSTTTTEDEETRSDSVEQKTDITQKESSSNKISNGRYWMGATDQGLEVKGARYRYDTEAGEQQWQPISNLKYVKNGVVFDGENYWCLSTLAPNPATGCSADGWNQ